MIFYLVSIAIPILTVTLLPFILTRLGTHQPVHKPLLYFAAIIFFISWYIPSPLINGQDTHFLTHLIGGGIYTGLIWTYIVRAIKWKPRHPSVTLPLSLFALVSTLGVTNELFEFAAVQLGLTRITLTDTSYDLVANTLGALMVYISFVLLTRFRRI